MAAQQRGPSSHPSLFLPNGERRSEDLEPFLSEVWAKDLSKPCHLYVT